MVAIKIKICTEYLDIVPNALAAFSCIPGLRPIGLSQGSLQTHLGLGYHVPVSHRFQFVWSCPMVPFCTHLKYNDHVDNHEFEVNNFAWIQDTCWVYQRSQTAFYVIAIDANKCSFAQHLQSHRHLVNQRHFSNANFIIFVQQFKKRYSVI